MLGVSGGDTRPIREMPGRFVRFGWIILGCPDSLCAWKYMDERERPPDEFDELATWIFIHNIPTNKNPRHLTVTGYVIGGDGDYQKHLASI